MSADRVLCIFQHEICEHGVFADRISIHERDVFSICKNEISAVLFCFQTEKFRDVMKNMDPFCKEQRNDDQKIDVLFFHLIDAFDDRWGAAFHKAGSYQVLIGFFTHEFCSGGGEVFIMLEFASMANKQ